MKSFAFFAFALLFAPSVLAQHQTFTVNSDASAVNIKLNTTHEVVNGTFHVQSGSIDFDRATSYFIGDGRCRSRQRQDGKRESRQEDEERHSQS